VGSPVGVVGGEVEVLHDVGDGQGRGPGDACQAVHQAAAVRLAHLVCNTHMHILTHHIIYNGCYSRHG